MGLSATRPHAAAEPRASVANDASQEVSVGRAHPTKRSHSRATATVASGRSSVGR
jgi:hypothetical protein